MAGQNPAAKRTLEPLPDLIRKLPCHHTGTSFMALPVNHHDLHHFKNLLPKIFPGILIHVFYGTPVRFDSLIFPWNVSFL